MRNHGKKYIAQGKEAKKRKNTTKRRVITKRERATIVTNPSLPLLTEVSHW